MEAFLSAYSVLSTLGLVVLGSRHMADQAIIKRQDVRLAQAMRGEIYRRSVPHQLPHVHKIGAGS